MRVRDIFSPKRWKSVFVWILQVVLTKLDGQPYPPKVHEVEQFMYRYLQCPECLAAGVCKHCGCKIPERMHVRRDHCSELKWGPVMTKENWEKYKTDYDIRFSVSYTE